MSTPAKVGVRQRERNALERISSIESDLQNIIQAVQKSLQSVEARINAQGEILDAIVQEVGAEQINARIESSRVERAEQHAKTSKEALEKAVADGEVVAGEEIDASSVVTGVEYDKDGGVVKPGYVQLGFNTIKPEFQEKLLGQKVGFKFDTADGSFEITGVYTIVPKAEEAPKAEVVA